NYDAPPPRKPLDAHGIFPRFGCAWTVGLPSTLSRWIGAAPASTGWVRQLRRGCRVAAETGGCPAATQRRRTEGGGARRSLEGLASPARTLTRSGGASGLAHLM